MGLSGDAQIAATNPNTRLMLVNTWKVDMFNQPELFATTAVQCAYVHFDSRVLSGSIILCGIYCHIPCKVTI